ncbi:acylphosphatase [Arvimicrobium flavum]|uniref:acylphosphatase n=1 Tax=Arvimicrobium flavum TaxID=3393320 RepID=UPI00237BEA75|nr:acylphosphatase [Mesorhizobium shangrilense]
MQEDRTATLARIRGVVQGVGFRYWTRDEARALGLSGWVRNEPDGSVTALIAGPADAVAAMLAKLRVGPSGARVTDVSTESADADALRADFRILR